MGSLRIGRKKSHTYTKSAYLAQKTIDIHKSCTAGAKYKPYTYAKAAQPAQNTYTNVRQSRTQMCAKAIRPTQIRNNLRKQSATEAFLQIKK